MKILGVPYSSNAADHYRILCPLEALQEAGLAQVTIAPVVDLPGGIQQRPVRTRTFTQMDRNQLYALFAGDVRLAQAVVRHYEEGPDASQFDITLITRRFEQSAIELIQAIRAETTRSVIYDIDDDLLGIPPSNPAYAFAGTDGNRVLAWHKHKLDVDGVPIPFHPADARTASAYTKHIRDGILSCVRAASALTVTTPELKRIYSAHNPNVYVLRNEMRLKEWLAITPIRHPGELWFGWAGSDTHLDDLKLIEKPIAEVLKRVPNAYFAVIGFPSVVEHLRSIPPDRVRTFGWMPIQEYREILAGMDVILAPSADNRINRAKSDIRVLEAYMCIRPVVGSEITYGPTIRESGAGYVAQSVGDWTRRICELLADEHLRKSMGLRGLKYAADTRTYQANVQTWFEVYQKVLTDERLRHQKRTRTTDQLDHLPVVPG